MVDGKGYFNFWIQCYHYVKSGSGKHRRRKKVVSHTVTEKFEAKICQDDSGNITSITDITKYVFINYQKRFYFADEQSKDIYDNAYESFIRTNKRDKHQSYSSTFEV